MFKYCHKLILVTRKSERPLPEYLDFIYACATSGITAVQLREKNLSKSELLTFGKHLHHTLKPLNIPLIINDDVDLCLQLDAEGVHLGQSDGNVHEARRLLGQQKIIGLTVNSISHLNLANQLQINYVGIGAIFPTNNKSNIELIGLNGLQQYAEQSKHPIVAIGGINLTNAKKVMVNGAKGIAAIDAFHDAQDASNCTQNLLQIIEEFTHATSN